MKGQYSVIIENRRVRYDFTIRRNITIIRGDSASGKTQLIEMLTAYERGNGDSGVTLACEKKCAVLVETRWEENLRTLHDSIVFIDEGAVFVTSDLFAKTVSATDNYYVIITRNALPNLPYSVEEIYGIRTSARYSGLKQTYNEFYHLYGNLGTERLREVECVIVEDSNAGYSFFDSVLSEGCDVVSAGGKSSIPEAVRNRAEDRTVLVVADGAAFGSEMERMDRLMHAGRRIAMYLPESFEWIVLSSGLIDDAELADILQRPQDHIESETYFSWEQFFTALLVKKTDGTYLKYTKSSLNPVYLQEKERGALLDVMKILNPMFQKKHPPAS